MIFVIGKMIPAKINLTETKEVKSLYRSRQCWKRVLGTRMDTRQNRHSERTLPARAVCRESDVPSFFCDFPGSHYLLANDRSVNEQPRVQAVNGRKRKLKIRKSHREAYRRL